ncbi:MAG: transposase, partial [Planctomycetaceae bacterium]
MEYAVRRADRRGIFSRYVIYKRDVMISDNARHSPSLPKGWPVCVKSSVLTVIALAHYAITYARGWAANSLNARVRQAAEIDQLRSEIAMLHEELRIKDARMAAIMPHRRPHYAPQHRMAILELKAARGWSLAQAAGAFILEPATLLAWLARIDESGPTALVQLSQPVNKFPDFVRYIIQRLKAVCPTMGKVKIAQTLARAGLHLGATTVGRMLKCELVRPPDTNLSSTDGGKPSRIVTAKRPNHVWHVDLTVVPTGGGFWTTWLPFSLPQRWPFCWWTACVIDHFSRRVMGIAVYNKQPDGRQVREFLAKTIRQNKASPKYIICDKGVQFWSSGFKRWCRRRKIKPRFGAVGQHGSIAVIERFIRTMKDECFRRLVVPLGRKEFMAHTNSYVDWYNCHRPHTAVGG